MEKKTSDHKEGGGRGITPLTTKPKEKIYEPLRYSGGTKTLIVRPLKKVFFMYVFP